VADCIANVSVPSAKAENTYYIASKLSRIFVEYYQQNEYIMTTDEVIDKLQQLVVGLLYPSETDAPIEVFVWRTAEKGACTDDNLAYEFHHPEDVLISESHAEEFFEGVTDIYEWHTPEEIEETKQFQSLRDTFLENVTKPRQLWFGERKVDVVVFGRTTDGDVVGLKTYIVET